MNAELLVLWAAAVLEGRVLDASDGWVVVRIVSGSGWQLTVHCMNDLELAAALQNNYAAWLAVPTTPDPRAFLDSVAGALP